MQMFKKKIKDKRPTNQNDDSNTQKDDLVNFSIIKTIISLCVELGAIAIAFVIIYYAYLSIANVDIGILWRGDKAKYTLTIWLFYAVCAAYYTAQLRLCFKDVNNTKRKLNTQQAIAHLKVNIQTMKFKFSITKIVSASPLLVAMVELFKQTSAELITFAIKYKALIITIFFIYLIYIAFQIRHYRRLLLALSDAEFELNAGNDNAPKASS